MHWFDAGDEASHEDSLRALAKGGFDEVLNGIGHYLGLNHLTAFSIGLLAVTKADKGVSVASYLFPRLVLIQTHQWYLSLLPLLLVSFVVVCSC